MKQQSRDELTEEIRKSVKAYLIVTCCFALTAIASIYFGYYVIRYNEFHELPLPMALVALGGGFLLWEMAKSVNMHVKLPVSFKAISSKDYPELFEVISEVTTRLNLSPVKEVYICPDASAAVFIQPLLRNLIFRPRINLVIGLGFLTQMNDDEIRAILYHEFGHYVQPEMKSSLSVYNIT